MDRDQDKRRNDKRNDRPVGKAPGNPYGKAKGKPRPGGPGKPAGGPKKDGPRPSGKPNYKPSTSNSSSAPSREQPQRRRRKLNATPKGVAAQAPAWLLDTQHAPQISSSNVTEMLEKMGFTGDKTIIASLVDHLLLVRELNREINLVSRANVDSVLLQSLWESLVPVLHPAKWRRGEKVLDLGSGGGFPGLCLAIAMPEQEFLLVDSRRAKTLALTSMVNDLGLKNVSVVHERAENLASHEDVLVDNVVVRAVGVLKEVAPWAEKLLKPGGTLLVWKGPEGLREFQALDRERWGLLETLPVLPHRSVMVLEYKGAAEMKEG
ncbi:16S rRNA (guanine(527)-N(7))-methyltransferase RsmG [bacterium]|nr:16S rRNA (guanine(527)-N(7))-methyltransferase RsmG [bacterium]